MNCRFVGKRHRLQRTIAAAERIGKRAQRIETELLIALHAREHLIEDRGRAPRRVLALVQRLLRDRAQEVLLALDPTEVRRRVGTPLAVHVRLVITRTHVRERLITVEMPAAGLGDVEPGLSVARRCRKVDRDRAERVDELLETGEVDFEVVRDRDVEVVLDGLDDTLRPGVERGVDLRRAHARDVDPEIAGEGHQIAGAMFRIDVRHHDRVGALAGLDVGAAEVRFLLAVLDERAGVGADEQEVVPRFEQRGIDLDGGDLGDFAGRDPVRTAHRGHRQQDDDDERNREASEKALHFGGQPTSDPPVFGLTGTNRVSTVTRGVVVDVVLVCGAA